MLAPRAVCMNYMGSKTKLLSFIDSVVTDCESKIGLKRKARFTDLFGGSGKVSEFYKNRFNVTANDIEFYSYVTLKNILQADAAVAASVDGYLYFLNHSLGIEGFINQNYSPVGGRMFFTEMNSQLIDAAVTHVQYLRSIKVLSKKQYYYLLGCILEAASKVANTAGHTAGYLKRIYPRAEKRIVFEHLKLAELKNKNNNVISMDASCAIEELSGDILYLDPPYTFNYSRMYHLLNTIVKNDEPEITGKVGLRKDVNKSPWSDSRKAKVVMNDILEKADFRYVIMSYSNESRMKPEAIADIFSAHGKYSCFTQEHPRYRAAKAANSPAFVTEYLHVLKKKV